MLVMSENVNILYNFNNDAESSIVVNNDWKNKYLLIKD